MEYNIPMADLFMQDVGIEKNTREFVLKLIGEGKELVGEYMVKNRSAEQIDKIGRFCAEAYEAYTGEKASEDDMNGVFDLCLMMQTCDSAAYTDMALTHSKERQDVYYRNYPAFNKSFESAHGLTGKKARLKDRPL